MGAASCVWTHKSTPDLRRPPHTLSQAASVSSSTSAALTGNRLKAQPPAISRQLLVSLLPCASPGVVPWAPPPPKLSQSSVPAAQRGQDGGHDCQADQEAQSAPAGTGRGPLHQGLNLGIAEGPVGSRGCQWAPIPWPCQELGSWGSELGVSWRLGIFPSFLFPSLRPCLSERGYTGMLRGSDQLRGREAGLPPAYG